MKKLKSIMLLVTSLFSSSLGLTLPTFADGGPCSGDIPEAVREASGCNGDDQFLTIIQNVLYTIIGICGIVAVIYIIIGGVSYMTSAGDPGKAQKARQTILYAVIGLVVCALAFAIVNFTIDFLLD